MKEIGIIIKHLRRNGGFTQKEFSQTLGISRSFLSEIESGDKNPSSQLLKSISRKIGIPLWALYLKTIDKEDISEKNKNEVLKELRDSIQKIESYFQATNNQNKSDIL